VLVPLFATTLFLTSSLLFAVEPLVAKGLLPALGGGAVVWTTSVAFFQVALVVGYLYAHLLAARLPARAGAALHVAVLAAVAWLLPLGPLGGWAPPAAHQALWLFARLTVTIGPPFVLLAATAPLLQAWVASTRHGHARDPYFLYAASNTGSLVALCAYPVVIEPLVGLARQRHLWNGGVGLAVAFVGACALVTVRQLSQPGERAPLPVAEPLRDGVGLERPRWSERARWLALAMVPSSLLLSVTTYVTTDLLALPLLWVIPLALYLATFILAFSRRELLSPRRMLWLQPLLLVPLAAEMFLTTVGGALVLIPVHLATFFVTALCCHQTLAASRPTAARSTEFYLWIAFGGALGGLFNVFLAPVLFRSVVEYPLGFVAAALLRPAPAPTVDGPGERRRDLALPALLAALLTGGVWVLGRASAHLGPRQESVALAFLLAAAGCAVYAFRGRPRRFGLGLAAMMASGAFYTQGAAHIVFEARSFYAVHKVVRVGPSMLRLANGNTVHGAQDLAPGRRREPLTYYSRGGPIGDVMKALAGQPQRRRVGLVGLGVGTLAAYAAPGEHWTYFEIDPAIVDIARDRGLFSYLADTRGQVDIVLGDGRLSLGGVPDGTFGLLVLDAFSSDAVPAHLLTREALALYARKLAPGGLLAFHLSNQYLSLVPVVAGAAAAEGLIGINRFGGVTGAEADAGISPSAWVVLAREARDLQALGHDARWHPLPREGRGWSDDASSLWSAFDLGDAIRR
jgi:SAM-dependent methyltransferase